MNRSLGEIIAVSIATAVPLEKLLKENAGKGNQYLYLNVKTLFRNFHGSFTTIDVPNYKTYMAEFDKELTMINAIITESIPGNIIPVFYYNTYKALGKCFPRATLKQPTTTKEINYESLEQKTINHVLKGANKTLITINDCLVKGNNTSALIITHMPLDLLSHSTFRKLTLLESHTGNLKTKTEWITKITKNESYRNLPLNILTIQVLGDHNLLFKSLGRKVSMAFIEIGIKCKWLPTTTLEKMKFDIRRIPDKLLSETLLLMSNSKLV